MKRRRNLSLSLHAIKLITMIFHHLERVIRARQLTGSKQRSRMRIFAALFISALVTVSCTAAPRSPHLLDPALLSGEFGEVALAPVVFADEPLDRYLGVEVANRIQHDAEQILRKRGYEVLVLVPPQSLQVSKAPADTDMRHLAPPVPPGSKAIVVIRIDHFFDTGIYERRARIPVELHGTAALMTPEGEVLWRAEGIGHASPSLSGYGSVEVFQLSATLVQSLFATLPP
jgi:hypothetical protein